MAVDALAQFRTSRVSCYSPQTERAGTVQPDFTVAYAPAAARFAEAPAQIEPFADRQIVSDGGADLVVNTWVVKVAPDIGDQARTGDTLIVDESDDATLVGRQLVVRQVLGESNRLTRRLICDAPTQLSRPQS